MKGSRRDRDYCTNSCSIQKEDNSLRHNAAKNFWTLNIEIPGFFHSKNDLKIDFFFQVEKWGKIIFSPKFN